MSPEDVAAAVGRARPDRGPARVLDVRAMAGRAEPVIDDGLGARGPVRDVLAPACRIAAVGHALPGRAGHRRGRVAVRHVPVAGHVPRLPDGGGRQGRRHDELAQAQGGPVGVEERDRLRGKVVALGSPVRRGRALSRERGRSRPLCSRHTPETECGEGEGCEESGGWACEATHAAVGTTGQASTLIRGSLCLLPPKGRCLRFSGPNSGGPISAAREKRSARS